MKFTISRAVFALLAFSGMQVAVIAGEQPLKAFASDVLIKTYSELDQRSGKLLAAVNALDANAGSADIEAVRKNWVQARIPWENSEAFLFGPVDTEGHDPELDSWPVNIADLNKVLDESSGPATIDAAAVAKLGEGEKGFHVIEFLLFADDNGKPTDAGTVSSALKANPRRLQYLKAATEVFKKRTALLLADYAGNQGYAAQIAAAGSDGSLYQQPATAYEEIVNGMIGIADESANEKILAPVEANDAGILESRFSGNTLQDVKDNIDGIKLSFDTAIAPKLATVDAQLNAEIAAAIEAYKQAVSAIPAPLKSHLESGKEQAQAAAEAGNTLRTKLEDALLPLVQKW